MVENHPIYQDYLRMLQYRESVGFATEADHYTLRPFIEFCCIKHPEDLYLKKEMLDEWLVKKKYISPKSQTNFIGLVRHFSTYVNAFGKESYMPDEDYTLPVHRYIPCIVDDDELRLFFDAIDKIPADNKTSRELILPVYYRFLFCCGMRPGEPLRLRMDDVNLETGDIYIRQSKNSKDRHIVMSEDMRQLCVIYDSMMGNREWFLPRWDGGPLTIKWTTRQIQRCKKLGLLKIDRRIRAYDLRHWFATRTIMEWIDEGKDVMALLPYLSTYMGHAKFTHTLYYLHLLPDRLIKSANIDWEQLRKVYGEVDLDEN